MSEGRDVYGGGEFEEKFIGLHVVIESGLAHTYPIDLIRLYMFI